MSSGRFWPVAFASIVGGASPTVTEVDCAVSRTSTGVYTVTLPSALSSTDFCALLSVNSGSDTLGRVVNIDHTSDTVKTLRVFTVAAVPLATDDFFLTLGIVHAIRVA